MIKQTPELLALCVLSFGCSGPRAEIDLDQNILPQHEHSNSSNELNQKISANEIVLYSGAGVAKRSLTEIPDVIEGLLGSRGYHVRKEDSSYFLTADWEKRTALIIMPGGADLPYVKALTGLQNKRIIEFVENGGTYVGFCAGAYYGSKYVEFDKSGPLEVLGERELGFFPGIARGPAYGVYHYENDEGARIAKIQMTGNDRIFYSYFNGGCSFVDADQYSNITVLGRYSDLAGKPAAFIECQVGKGKAYLLGFHPEFTLDSFPVESSQASELVERQHRHWEDRKAILNIVFSDLPQL